MNHNLSNRKEHPHHVIITMKIDIRKILPDGTLDQQVLGNKLLSDYGISNKAQFYFSAVSEAEAIKYLKQKLERLNG
jgi:hypothetical protein